MMLPAMRQTDIMTQRQPLRQLHDDEVKLLGYAVGVAVNNPDEDLSSLGHKLGMVAGAAMESFPR